MDLVLYYVREKIFEIGLIVCSIALIIVLLKTIISSRQGNQSAWEEHAVAVISIMSLMILLGALRYFG